jgi:glycosyltransferase involved in cell wall biosynthesis
MKLDRYVQSERVTILLPAMEVGGAERQAFNFARYLQHSGRAAVEIVALKPGRRLVEWCERDQIPWRVVPVHGWPVDQLKLPDWPAVWRVSGRIRAIYHALTCCRTRLVLPNALAEFACEVSRTQPDVIIAYTSLANIISGLTWRHTGARLAVWGQRDQGLDLGGSSLDRLAVSRTPLFISNSEIGAEYLRRQYDLPVDQVHIVRNGVMLAPVGASRQEWRRRLNLSDDEPAACMVGNIHDCKDHPTLIRAWAEVDRQWRARYGRRPHLFLAGRKGPTAPAVEALIEQLEMHESIRLLGEIDDVSGLLGAMDLAVFSSHGEGMPNGVLEPMAAGLPVVATDLPGVREAMGPGSGHWLVRPAQPEPFAQSVLDLMDEPELRRVVGEQNRKWIRDEFSLDAMCERMCRLILRPADAMAA